MILVRPRYVHMFKDNAARSQTDSTNMTDEGNGILPETPSLFSVTPQDGFEFSGYGLLMTPLYPAELTII